MFSEIDDKRNKFANEKRRQIHEKMFELNRQWKNNNFNALSFLPSLIDQNSFLQINSLLDEIDIQKYHESQLNQKVLSQIKSQQSNHHDEEVRILMLKLMNRINIWEQCHFEKAVELLKNGEEAMIKELALFFQLNCEQERIKEYFNQMHELVFNYQLKNEEYAIFWVDLLCNCFNHINSDPFLFIKDIDNLIQNLGASLLSPHPSSHIRVIQIFNRLASEQKTHKKIISLEGFNTIIQCFIDGSSDFVIEGLELLAQLLGSSDPSVILQIIRRYDIIKIMSPYLSHIFDEFRTKSLWAYSNIVGQQETYGYLLADEKMMDLFRDRLKKEEKTTVRIQLYYFYLNIFCNCRQNDDAKAFLNEIDVLKEIINFLEVQYWYKKQLLTRLLYSISNLVNLFPFVKEKLLEVGVDKNLKQMYEVEKETSYLQMLNCLLELFEKPSF